MASANGAQGAASKRRGTKPTAQQLGTALTAENVRLAVDLASSRQQAVELSAAVQQVQAAAVARDVEHLRLCDFLRQELHKREQAAAQAAEEYRKAQDAATADLHAAERHGREQRQISATAAQAAADQLMQRVTVLQSELASVAAFREREKSMAVDAVVLQEGITQLQAEMLDQACHAYRYEGRLVQLAERLNSQAAARLLEAAAIHEEDVDTRLDERSRQLVVANGHLEASLRLHSEESATLLKLASYLKAENQRLLRELSLNADAEQHSAQRAAILVRDRAEAQKAAAGLDAALVECSRAAEERILAGREVASKALDEQAGEMDALRRLLKLREHEMHMLRAKAGRQALTQIAHSGLLRQQLPRHNFEVS